MTRDPRLKSDEFAAGMTARREMRKLATDVARASRLDPQMVLAFLVLAEKRSTVDSEALAAAVGKELADHRADVRVETLARIGHLADGIPV